MSYKLSEHRRNYQKEYQRRYREKVLKKLGNKCIKCGFTDYRALQIDHVNGGGLKENREHNYSSWMRMKVIFDDADTGKYQLLCANCNWIKRWEKNENSNLTRYT